MAASTEASTPSPGLAVQALQLGGHPAPGATLLGAPLRSVAPEGLAAALAVPGLTVVVAGTGLQLPSTAADALAAQAVSPLPAIPARIAADPALGPRGRLVYGVAHTTAAGVVVGLPGDPAVLSAAATVLAPLTAAAPAPAAAAVPAAPPAGVQVLDIQPAAAAPAPPPAPRGWEAALAHIGATVDRGAWGPMPEAVHRFAPVRDVLERAGERRPVQDDHGRRWTAFGFPDLRRAGSKVLLVRETDALIEIIALHRAPARVGVCGDRDEAWLPPSSRDPGPVSVELVGARPPGWGRLFALEGDAVYVERDGRIHRWDGRRETPVGTIGQALASLVLRWSQR